MRPSIIARLRLKALALCVWAGAISGFTEPSDAQVIWQMTTEYPATNISGVGLTTFGKLVSARTNGFVTTVNAFDNVLKIESIDMFRAAKQSRIAGGDAFAGPLETKDIIFGLPSLPFVVQSIASAKAMNLRARALYDKALQAKGLKLLYVTIWPASGIWSDRPVTTANDLRALAIRTYDNNSAEVMRAAGATAETLSFNEALLRVSDHKLNSILSSGDGGAGRKLWDYLRYFTAINYVLPISVAFVRQEEFDSLPQPMQEQVQAAADETEHQQIEHLSERLAANYRQMHANGVVITDPAPPEVIAALRAAAHTPIAAWEAKAGSEATEIAEWAIQQ